MSSEVQEVEFIEEDLTSSDLFFYNKEEIDLLESFYSLPIQYPFLDIIDRLRETYLHQYAINGKELENLIPFDEYMDYLDFTRDLMLFREEDTSQSEDQQAKNEPTNTNDQIDELEDKDTKNDNAFDDDPELKFSEKDLIDNGFYPTRFIIHEHNARSFHYDLRFGTRYGKSAFSFAIPKAKLPQDYQEKILALKQPMHPVIWLDLKSTDTFRDESSKGPMGTVKLVDRGPCYVKERNGSFVIYLAGSIYKGGYILVHVGSSNSYMILKTDKIMSDEDSRNQEWRANAFKIYNYQKKIIMDRFRINCNDTKLIFEDNNGNLSNMSDKEVIEHNSFEFIVIPNQNSEEVEVRKKANPERLPIQLLTEMIAFRFGRYIYHDKIVSDKIKTAINTELTRIDFTDKYLEMIETVTDDIRFAEVFSCIISGHNIFKDSSGNIVNLGALLAHTIENNL